jgi:hypothetical protein
MGNNNTPAPENDARFIANVIQVKKRKSFKKCCVIFFY